VSRSSSGVDPAGGERVFLRWDVHQRIQHVFLVVAFTLLVVTGMPLKYPDAISSRIAVAFIGGADNAGAIHRFAAVTLIVVAAYHVLYLLARLVRRRLGWSMIGGRKDVEDLVGMLAYFVGLRRTKPKFERYSFKEKSEYWAVIWGSAVMIGSGLILWFPEYASRLFRSRSGLAFDIARTIHSYEALLAMLAIIVWHLYNAHLAPGFFPMNWVWINGKISERQLKDEHPLEYERIMAGEPIRTHRVTKPRVSRRPAAVEDEGEG
jgi:formate dehydrogenase subunit gamma